MPKEKNIPALKAQPLVLRLNYCAGALAIHNLITPAERARIHKRLLKLKAREEAAHAAEKGKPC